MEKSAEKQTAGFLFNSQQTDHDKVRTAKKLAFWPAAIESVVAIRVEQEKSSRNHLNFEVKSSEQ